MDAFQRCRWAYFRLQRVGNTWVMREKKNRPCVRKVNKPKDRKDSCVCLEDSETQTWANAKVCAPNRLHSPTSWLALQISARQLPDPFTYMHSILQLGWLLLMHLAPLGECLSRCQILVIGNRWRESPRAFGLLVHLTIIRLNCAFVIATGITELSCGLHSHLYHMRVPMSLIASTVCQPVWNTKTPIAFLGTNLMAEIMLSYILNAICDFFITNSTLVSFHRFPGILGNAEWAARAPSTHHLYFESHFVYCINDIFSSASQTTTESINLKPWPRVCSRWTQLNTSVFYQVPLSFAVSGENLPPGTLEAFLGCSQKQFKTSKNRQKTSKWASTMPCAWSLCIMSAAEPVGTGGWTRTQHRRIK